MLWPSLLPPRPPRGGPHSCSPVERSPGRGRHLRAFGRPVPLHISSLLIAFALALKAKDLLNLRPALPSPHHLVLAFQPPSPFVCCSDSLCSQSCCSARIHHSGPRKRGRPVSRSYRCLGWTEKQQSPGLLPHQCVSLALKSGATVS